MNPRSVSRGDAAVALATILLLVSSFLPLWQAKVCLVAGNCQTSSVNSWHAEFFPLLPAVTLAGVVGGLLALAGRLLPEARRNLPVAGLRAGQWGTALTVSALWAALWSLFSTYGQSGDGVTISHGLGTYLNFVFALLLAAAVIAGPLVPALRAPLLPEGKSAPPAPGQAGAQQPFSAPPGGQSAGTYGYPGGGYGYGGTPGATPGANPGASAAAPGTAAGAQPPTPWGTGPQSPQSQQAQAAPATPGSAAGTAGTAGADEPTRRFSPVDAGPAAAGATGAAAAAGTGQSQPSSPSLSSPTPASGHGNGAPFSPFWFAVPANRPLRPVDDPNGATVGELTPGTWYLAMEQRGSALVVQTQDEKRGLLTDTTGIQRG